MNLPGITFGDGLVLTDPIMVSKFATITGHQITFADFALQFVWGSDQDLDGAGLQAVAHINGTTADARFFGNGDDSDAIQRAIDFVAATSEGRGVVLIPAIAGTWTIDTEIVLASGVEIRGVGLPELRMTVSGHVFVAAAAANLSDIRISGLNIDGNNTGRGLVDIGDLGSGAATMQRLVVDHNVVSGQLAAGYFVDCGSLTGATLDDIVVTRNRLFNGASLLRCSAAAAATNIRVTNNHWMVTGSPGAVGTPGMIDITTATEVEISSNYCNFDTASAASTPIAINLQQVDRSVVRDNQCWGGGSEHLFINNCDQLTVQGNQFRNAGSVLGGGAANAAITMSGACKDVIIRDNVCSSDPTFATLRCNYGIDIPVACVDTVVVNNILEDLGTAAGRHQQILAGIRDNGTTTKRWGNKVIQDQYVGQAGISGGAGTYQIAVNGLRTAASDAARNAQYLAHQVTGRAAIAVQVVIDNTTTYPANNQLQIQAGALASADVITVA